MSAIRYSKITIRQPTPLKAKIEQAAAMRGMTVTSFINGALDLAADETVSRVQTREVSAKDSELLLAMLAKPSRPNAALRTLAKRYSKTTGA